MNFLRVFLGRQPVINVPGHGSVKVAKMNQELVNLYKKKDFAALRQVRQNSLEALARIVKEVFGCTIEELSERAGHMQSNRGQIDVPITFEQINILRSKLSESPTKYDNYNHIEAINCCQMLIEDDKSSKDLTSVRNEISCVPTIGRMMNHPSEFHIRKQRQN